MLKRFYLINIFIISISNIYASNSEELSIYAPNRFGFSSHSIQTIQLDNVNNGPRDNYFSLASKYRVQKGSMRFTEHTLYNQPRGSNPLVTINNSPFRVDNTLQTFSDNIKLNISTYGIARLTFDSYQRFNLSNRLDIKLNPHDTICQVGSKNAYYQATNNFIGGIGNINFCVNQVATAQYFDVVAHETGHSILDALQYKYIYDLNGTTPLQYNTLHESFADLSTIFASAQLARIKNKDQELVSFLSNNQCLCIAFGMGEKEGCLRNFCNTPYGCEPHDLSMNFTGFFDAAMKDIFKNTDKSVQSAVWTFDFFQKLLMNSVQLHKEFNNLYDFAEKMINQPFNQDRGYSSRERSDSQTIKNILSLTLNNHKNTLERMCSTPPRRYSLSQIKYIN